jgi:hypothetical protein
MQVKKVSLLVITLLAILLLVTQGFHIQNAYAKPDLRSQSSAGNSPEFWKTGVTIEDTSLYSATIGRLLTDSASFRSGKASNTYFVFPASADAHTIQSVSYLLLNRTGSYAGTAQLTLEVFDLNGNLLRTASSAPVNLVDLSLSAWNTLALSANSADLMINPGEFLAFHCKFSDGPGGDLEVRPIFEITLK